jgi:beta-barrel assembly-enhancing protease
VSGFFYNLGRQLGRKAMPAIRKTKNTWEAMLGSDEDALPAEVALGKEMAEEMRKTLEMRPEAEASRHIREICRNLQELLRDKRRNFSCELFRDPSPQAVALPGGFLFMSDGLVDFCNNRSEELAFVIGHEIAHVALKHVLNRVVSDTAFKMASVATARFGPLGGVVRAHGLSWMQNAHSRDCELEADEMGYRLARKGGYEPAGGFTFLRRVDAVSQEEGTGASAYFTSHPAAKIRIARLASVEASSRPKQ